MAWVQRDPKDHPVPNSLPSHQTRLLQALSSLGLEHLQGCPSSQPSFLVVKGAKFLNQNKLLQTPLSHQHQPQPQLSPWTALPSRGQHTGALFSDCPPTPHVCRKLLLHLPSPSDLMATPESKKHLLFFLPNPFPETVPGLVPLSRAATGAFHPHCFSPALSETCHKGRQFNTLQYVNKLSGELEQTERKKTGIVYRFPDARKAHFHFIPIQTALSAGKFRLHLLIHFCLSSPRRQGSISVLTLFSNHKAAQNKHEKALNQ